MEASRKNAKPSVIRRVLACLVSAALAVAFTPVVAWGATTSGVTYLDAGGNKQSCSSATVVESSTTTWNSGWYVVNSDVTINERITVSGIVNLILADGKTLDATKGISVSVDNSLTIYAQSTGASIGSLTATGGRGSAGIGGGGSSVNGGTIIINGGNVNATGGTHGAGIGGGGDGTTPGIGGGGNIIINGGNVNATGGIGGAGIGGGYSRCNGNFSVNVTISGGTVEAREGQLYGGKVDGIGNGYSTSTASVFSTGDSGNAVIFASSIGDQSNKDSWGGVVFEGASNAKETSSISQGTHNPTVTINDDLVLNEGDSMTIGSSAEVVVSSGKTLTNKGTITNRGTLTNNGTIKNFKTISGTVNNNQPVEYYTISYELDGGTNDRANPVEYAKGSSTIALYGATKTGYTFKGWYAASDFSGSSVTAIAAGETGTKEYWAKWEATEYDISYNLNGGSLDQGKTNPDKYTVETETFTLNKPSKVGYSFAGWSGTGLTEGTENVTITNGSTGKRSYTANWTANTNTAYVVNHWQQNINGGDECNDTNFTLVSSDTENLTGTTASEVTPAVKSYTGFAAPSTQTVSIAADDSTVVNYYYTRNSYTITFDTDGGSDVASITKKYGADVAAPENPTKTGYTFKSWSEDVPATMPAENKTLTAQWTLDIYDITYVLDGGSNDDANPDKYTIESDTITLKPGKRSGYTFEGWYDGTGANVTEIAKGSTGDVSLTAKWKVIYVPPATPQASASCIKAISALPDVDAITLEDGPAIEAARESYEALTDYQKSFVPAASVEKLEAAEARYGDLVAVAPVESALTELPQAADVKTSQAKAAVKRAQAALAEYAALDDGQKALVDEALIANAQEVVVKGAVLIAKADKKAVGKVKNKAFSVKVGTSKSIYFKTLLSAAGTKVTYKKASGSSYITVSKAGKVTAKKGMKEDKTYTAKIKVTCGKSWKYVKVTVKVRG